jgi:hypothetical protein
VEPVFRGSATQKAVRDDATAASYVDHLRNGRANRIAAARDAVVLDRKGHFVYEGCASFAEFGERRGGSSSEAAMVLALGYALERWPELEAALLDGTVSEASASRMGMLAKRPHLLREDDEWVAWARGESEKAFARRVRERREEGRTGGKPVVERTFYVTTKGASRFDEARKLASRKAERVLTEGEALETISDHYLDCFDLRRGKPGKRRMPHTATIEDRRLRKPAAEVLRAILERTGDRCAVPFCPNEIFVENSHRRAHASGGAREREDLDRLCVVHHDMYHQGLVRITGPADDPRFSTADGRSLGERAGFATSGDPPR